MEYGDYSLIIADIPRRPGGAAAERPARQAGLAVCRQAALGPLDQGAGRQASRAGLAAALALGQRQCTIRSAAARRHTSVSVVGRCTGAQGHRLPARSSILQTAMTNTRIVTHAHRLLHERRPRNGATERPCARCGQPFVSRQRRKEAAEAAEPLADVPVIVTPADTKKGRRPVLARGAAAEVGTRLGQGGDGETEVSTAARVTGHDRSVTTQPANDTTPAWPAFSEFTLTHYRGVWSPSSWRRINGQAVA
jgi:hypothetical protein